MSDYHTNSGAESSPHGASTTDEDDPTSFRGSDADAALASVELDADALHASANRRLEASAAADRTVSFGRQMLQLTVIPALIVISVLGVWMLIITLGGRGQTLTKILDRLETVPAGEGGELIDRAAHQERARAAVNLMGWIDDPGALAADDRQMLIERLPEIAKLYQGREPELSQYIMGALGALAAVETLPTFETMLRSDFSGDRLAAAFGLASWDGPARELRPLSDALVEALGRATGDTDSEARMRTLTSLVLAGAASPDDLAARNALAEVVERFGASDRDAAWNAGAALAALGDERGVPVLLTLLDREDLATRLQNPKEPDQGALSAASQDKLIGTAINIVIGYDPDSTRHYVRVHDEQVWNLIEEIAKSDPSDEVRALAEQALAVRDFERGELIGAAERSGR